MMQLLYIDPGSGSYLVQVIIAAVLGAFFFLKDRLLFIKHLLFPGKKNKQDKEETKNPEEGN
jgi:hypothetical protein